jgi:CheY-like chemotaxis protein
MAHPAAEGHGFRAIAGAISRDVRTPLHSVLGFLELLGISGLDGEQRDTFEYVMRDTDTLSRAADRLLLLCELVAGDHATSYEPFDVSELLGEAAAGTDADVRIVLDTAVPPNLIGDVANLEQLLKELLDNAAAHGSGQITLAVAPDGPITLDDVPLRFSVTEHGSGLPWSQLAFLQAPLSTAPEAQIGLYLVKHIVARLGGRLTVERPPVAARVSAHLTLTPALVSGTPLILETLVNAAAATSGEPQPLKVLLVEDNAVNLTLAKRQMKVLGHELHTATRGRQGVEAALADDFDVILMDRHLPDLDGVEATMEIRAAEASSGRHTPIFAVTADAMPRNRAECLAAGMDGFLTKPLDIEALRATLAGLTPASVAVAGTDGEVLDRDAFYRLADSLDDPEQVAELVHEYVAELPGRRLRLQHALRQFAVAEIVRSAKTLRVHSATVGAHRLADLCGSIIDAAEAGDASGAHARIPQLRVLCQLTIGAITTAAKEWAESAEDAA